MAQGHIFVTLGMISLHSGQAGAPQLSKTSGLAENNVGSAENESPRHCNEISPAGAAVSTGPDRFFAPHSSCLRTSKPGVPSLDGARRPVPTTARPGGSPGALESCGVSARRKRNETMLGVTKTCHRRCNENLCNENMKSLDRPWKPAARDAFSLHFVTLRVQG